MKQGILLMLVLWSSCGFAQSYVNSPADSLSQNTTLGAHAIVMNITQTHTTRDTLHFHWHRLSVSLPLGWSASICDNGNCYDSLIDHGTMTPILPGDNGLMSIHCTADTTTGMGIIRYTLYEEKTPAKVDTLTWIVYADPSGIASIQTSKPAIRYASGQLSLKNISDEFTRLEVYDVSGRSVFQNELYPGEEQYSIADLAVVIVRLSGVHSSYAQKIVRQ